MQIQKVLCGEKKSVHNYFIYQPKPDFTGIHHPAPRQPWVHSEDDKTMAVCNCQLLSVNTQGWFQSNWNLWCAKWHYNRLYTKYFGFPLSI